MAKKPIAAADRARELALGDLEKFISLVDPKRELGQCHKDLIRWWTRDGALSHQLVLLPRDHQKSALVAFRVAWEITKNPALRILYISSTSKLAIKQLKLIKDILTCEQYKRYWPEMVNVDDSKREKWTETEIAVDHPSRRIQFIRDPTVFTAGLTTNIVGMHCDIAVLDDVVVDDNAYNDEGRERVRNQASYLASILGTNGRLWCVGTRYHPLDLYNDFKNQVVIINDPETGEVSSSYNLYEHWEKQVEDRGDGTGNYLWPKPTDSIYGFNQQILAVKKAQYQHDLTKFRAQYYNNPNDASTATITADMFQYYSPGLLSQELGRWYYKGRRLNVFAAVDFAYSLAKKADYTAVVVIGVDSTNSYYILDIDRFKSNKISDYFDHILRLHTKWGFRKLRAEVTAAQEVIVKDLKENYIKPHGLALSIEEFRPTRHAGTKEERIEATLQPKYSNRQIWHYSGGHCSILEEELILQRPAHDDVKDCLASVIDTCVPPARSNMQAITVNRKMNFHPRFGGIA